MEIQRTQLGQGLQVVRFSVVFFFLLSMLSTIVPALGIVTALLPLAIVVGQAICFRATSELGLTKILAALVLGLVGLLAGFLLGSVALQLIGALGMLGVLVVSFGSLLLCLASTVCFLLYASELATYLKDNDTANHFQKLIGVLVAMAVIPFVSLVLPGGLAIMGPLIGAAIGVMFVLSFSGAMAGLINKL